MGKLAQSAGRAQAGVESEADGAVPAPLPEDESSRLEALRSLCVLDSEPESDFDELTRAAAFLAETPIALVSLVDEDRQWFKSRVGLDAPETPRRLAFCAHAVVLGTDLIVPNALKDPRFRTNPLVVGGPMIRFYAGFPLRLKDGHVMGTLCVIDRRPRRLKKEQLEGLRVLARLASLQLEDKKERTSLQARVLQQEKSVSAANISLSKQIIAAHKLNRKLEETQRKLRLAIDAAGLATWTVDFVAKRTTYDETTRLLIGAPEGVYEADGGLLLRIVHPDDREMVAAALDKALKGNGQYEVHHRAVVGERVYWTVVQGVVVFDRSGKPLRLHGSQFDVTPLKEAELAREQELLARVRMTSVLERVNDAFLAFDREWNIVHANPRAAELFESPVKDLIGRNFLTEYSERMDRKVMRAYKDALESGEPRTVEYCDEAQSRWFENRVFPGEDGVSAYFHEITERKRAEHDLQRASERQRSLSRRLVTVQEKEVRRLSSELHDRIGQNLAALRVHLKLATKLANLPALAGHLQSATELVGATVIAVRTMLKELRPAVLDDLGLVAALRTLGDDFEKRTGVATTTIGDDRLRLGSLDIELAFYRIAQEALNNASKYAQAKNMMLQVSGGEGEIEMTVRDDGVGFDRAASRGTPSWGMQIMRERAEAVGAWLTVESSPGSGTCVRVVAEVKA